MNKGLAKRFATATEEATVEAAGSGVRLRWATIVGIASTTVTIQFANGSDIAGVHRNSNYSPTINDSVAVLQNGTDYLVICKAA